MCCLGASGLLAGSGGGDKTAPPKVGALAQPAQPETPAAATQPPATAPAVPAPQSFPTSPLAKIEQRALARLQQFQRDQRRQQKLTAAQHAHAQIGAVRDLTDAVVVAAGLPYATVDVLDGGSTVIVNVDRKSACGLHASDASGIEDRIINASDVVVRVKLRVDGTAQSLGRYLRKSCHESPAGDAGIGKVLYSTDGSGTADTPVVTITSKSWKLEWESSSALLQIYVYRDGKLQSVAVNHQGRGGATKTLRGPGRFKLHVAGTGQWTVRVLDGRA
jgi:hypothetical protein